jgi:CBS-domain-containing membrane protein
MSSPIPARRLMIYLGESDSWRGRSLYMSILETLRKNNIAGATVTRAIAGFGAHSHVRTHTVEILSMDLPIVVSVVDTPENIDRALALVGPMVREGLVTLEDVAIMKYTHRHLHPLPVDSPAAEFMTADVVTVTPDTPARQVVEMLKDRLFKAVPVIDSDRRVVGIITEGDLLRHAGLTARLAVVKKLEADDLRLILNQVSESRTARQIMTTPVVTVYGHDPLGLVVERLLQHDIKHIPVIDNNGRLVGIISRLDVLRTVTGTPPVAEQHVPHLLHRIGHTLGEVMSSQMPLVYINDDLNTVLEKLLDTSLHRAVVLDERSQPVGIITDSDTVTRVNPAARHGVLQTLAARMLAGVSSSEPVTARDLMSENVLTARASLPVADAIELLINEGRKLIVVTGEHGEPVGVVDRQMLIAASLDA